MGHHSHHNHHEEGNIKVAFFLNLAFSIIEIIGGLWTNSVAILSDALHDFGDSLTLGLSWYFAKISKKKKTKKFSYGFKRFSILGALINAIVLICGSILIMMQAIPRLLHPVNPETKGMIYIAILGLVINGLAAYRLSYGKSLNEKVVFTHLLEDILGWVAVSIGAIIMHFTNLPIIDPILSILIAIFILFNIYKSLKESFRIILQGTPSTVNLKMIHQNLLNIPHVKDFHDCHAWSMDGEYNILSVHLIIDKNLTLSELESIKKETKEKLHSDGIDHVTIEFEMENETCDPC